jgi:hypothetical protein
LRQVMVGNIPYWSVHWGLVIGLTFCVLLHLVLRHTTLGFSFDILGGNRRAAQMAGLPIGRLMCRARAAAQRRKWRVHEFRPSAHQNPIPRIGPENPTLRMGATQALTLQHLGPRGTTTTRDRARFMPTTRLAVGTRFTRTVRVVVVTFCSFLASWVSSEGRVEVWSAGKRSLNVTGGSLESCANAPNGAVNISERAVIARNPVQVPLASLALCLSAGGIFSQLDGACMTIIGQLSPVSGSGLVFDCRSGVLPSNAQLHCYGLPSIIWN